MSKKKEIIDIGPKYKQKAVAVTTDMVKVFLSWPKKIVDKNSGLAEDSRLTTTEYKLLWMLIGEINWRRDDNDNKVTISCSNVARRLGWNMNDSENVRKASYFIREHLISLKKKSSVITIKDSSDKESFICASLFGNIYGNINNITVEINPIFMPYLHGFIKVLPFLTYWQEDLDTMETYVGMNLGLALKAKSDYSKDVSFVEIGTAELKSKIFGCEKNEYTSLYRGKRKFNRTLFEKRKLDVACEDINLRSKYIHLLPQIDENGNECLYIKTHKGPRVDKYLFKVQVDRDLMNDGMYYFNNDDDDDEDVDIGRLLDESKKKSKSKAKGKKSKDEEYFYCDDNYDDYVLDLTEDDYDCEY